MVGTAAGEGRAAVGEPQSGMNSKRRSRTQVRQKAPQDSALPASSPGAPSGQRSRASKEKVVWEFLRPSKEAGVGKGGSYEDHDEMAPEIAPESPLAQPTFDDVDNDHTAQLQEALTDERTELQESQGGNTQPEWTLPCNFDCAWLNEVEHEQAKSDVNEFAMQLTILEEKRRAVDEQYEAAQRRVVEEVRRQGEQWAGAEDDVPPGIPKQGNKASKDQKVRVECFVTATHYALSLN